MKKKGTIGIVATLGLGLCAYALSQQPQEIVIVCLQ